MRSDTMKAGNALAMEGELWTWVKAGGFTGGALGTLALFLRFVAWLLPWKDSRDDRKQDRLDKAFSAYTKKMEDRNELLEKRCEAFEGEIVKIKADLADCERKHIESDRRLMEMDGMIQAAGLAKQMAQQIIASKERDA